jgi:2-dehydropantoate 2-reductase
MRGTVGEINAAPGGADFGARVAAEAMAISTAAGHPPRAGAVSLLRSGLASTEPMAPSLYRDLVQGLPVEADAILGDFVVEAAKHEVPAPMLSAAYTALSIYSTRRAG